ncbi:putative porin [Mangrovimonas aestuarii]|uniref:putative porin n=1 Tax=Mangrovimonas aestuarii TaxID=3018443 RepID=UPI002379D549|nr:putative porin [Mangrovimonas aestuarii]
MIKRIILISCLLMLSGMVHAQIPSKKQSKRLPEKGGKTISDSIGGVSNKGVLSDFKKEELSITDYKIISRERDTTFVDTTLSIYKEYKFNYLRKDDFELLPFSNMGQTYNSLSYQFQNVQTVPSLGSQAKHFNYMEAKDINYYHVPTPLSELMYKSAFEQGQLLDAFFTTNISKQINFSVAYKGMRSLGKYQHILSSTGNFRTTLGYISKNGRYDLKTHFVSQDILNEENGGIIDEQISEFESGNQEFKDRGVFDVNFEDVETMLRGKRFFIDHRYKLIGKDIDSLQNNTLYIGHILNFEDKYYEFNQSKENDYFGDAFTADRINNRATLESFYNQLNLQYTNSILGDLQFSVQNTDYNYGYDEVVVLNNETITNRLKGNIFAVGGSYAKTIKGFNLFGQATLNLSDEFTGNSILAEASYNINDDISLSAGINNSSRAPNFNTLLYHSDYKNYNWQNNFSNIKTQQLSFGVQSKKWGAITGDVNTITDYVYFKKDEADGVKPFQENTTLSYFRLKFQNEFRLGHFALNNTVMYQKEGSGTQVLNVPEIITRNTLYYSNHFFKRALFLQTGVTFKYFSSYYMDAYDPLLAEFYVQTDRSLGNFPLMDFFVNAKISQTRIYLKAEHFNSVWTGYNYYSAPSYPYRDFIIRLGLVWNFFL